MALNGAYYSNYFTSEAEGDLIAQLKTELSVSNILIKKMTLISDTDITLSVNGNTGSHLFLNPNDSLYSLSLGENDVSVNSLVVTEAGASIFLAVIY